MAQRDHEDQPEAADLGSAIQLESSDTLEGPPGADALDAGYVPPDRPYALDDDAVTGAGMREGDTLDERLARERPEDAAGGDPDRSGRIAIAGEGAAMETTDAMDGVDVGIDGGAASAEEAAVHDVDAGTRVDGEPSVADAPQLADPELDATLDDERDAIEQARADAARDVAAGVDGTGVVDGTGPRR